MDRNSVIAWLEGVGPVDVGAPLDPKGPSLADLPFASTSNGDVPTTLPSSTAATAGTSAGDESMSDVEKHHGPTAVYLSMMSGRLAAIDKNGASITRNDGFSLIDLTDDGATSYFFRDASLISTSFRGRLNLAPWVENKKKKKVNTPEQLHCAKRFLFCNASGTPKLVFRGFNSGSGGGHDPRLNSRSGVVPHGFLNGQEPTELWDIRKVRIEINDHLKTKVIPHTHFSSWSQMLVTSMDFAREFTPETEDWIPSSTIAVLDTDSMEEHMWLCSDLFAAGLCQEMFTDEFLIYGPISGPKYHCVSVDELLNTTRILEIINWDGLGTAASFGDDRIGLIEREAVEACRDLAKALQPRNAGLDKIVLLTARFVGNRAAVFLKEEEDSLSYRDISGFLYYVRDDLQCLATQDNARRISLAVPDMSTLKSQALMFEVQMLLAAENAIHILAWMRKASFSGRIFYYLVPMAGEHLRRLRKKLVSLAPRTDVRGSGSSRRRKRESELELFPDRVKRRCLLAMSGSYC